MKTLTVLHALQLVTLAGPKRARVEAELVDLSIVPNGGMLVRDGVIVATGPSVEIERQVRVEEEVVDAADRVALLRFVDSQDARMAVVPDGADNSRRWLERVLTSGPGMGVFRHADTGHSRAIGYAARKGNKTPTEPKARN